MGFINSKIIPEDIVSERKEFHFLQDWFLVAYSLEILLLDLGGSLVRESLELGSTAVPKASAGLTQDLHAVPTTVGPQLTQDMLK